jgi:spoIIIJ-associated protein
MNDLTQSVEKVASFMRLLTTFGHIRLKYRITAGAGAADPAGLERREIYVECKGPDSELLLENDAELLRSLEHISAQILNLDPEDHDRISFDAEGYKAERARSLQNIVDDAIDFVDDHDKPFHFSPMNSRERRMVHLLLTDSGLQTASTGAGPARAVVLYPEGYTIPPEPTYSSAGRSSDRPRRPANRSSR